MSSNKKDQGFFTTDDGQNLTVTFILVCSLFFLWAVCNGMIDTMDKHFQNELGLTKSQSAWVQFAHYLGYFLMSLPAGWLATKLGYKGGIITGLVIVALGGFWFIPATYLQEASKAGHLSAGMAFVGFLFGVCVIATGLTFLETIANPYTTVLGNPRFAAARINLAQSINGVGWVVAPIIGSTFFYSQDAQGASTGSETLYIPYVAVAIVVAILAVVFFFAKVPDIKSKDDYHLDDNSNEVVVERTVNRPLVYVMLLLNATVLIGICGMILWLILTACNISQRLVGVASSIAHPLGIEITADNSLLVVICAAAAVLVALAVLGIIPVAQRVSHHSIWSHPHFSAATLAQFFYVAAQAGIFSFFINYMTSEPVIPESWTTGTFSSWFQTTNGMLSFTDKFAGYLTSIGFACFVLGRFTGAGLLKKFSAHKILALYGALNVFACLLVVLKLGWLSVACVFLSYFLMSIMFPTIFALGIFGLGARAKKASAFIVMAIMGGAVLPKAMGYVADQRNMSVSFIVPLVCFAIVAIYGLCWPLLSQTQSAMGLKTSGGH